MIAQEAIKRLTEGNERFIKRLNSPGEAREIPRFIIDEGQSPHTVVLTCSDSRLDPVMVFDGTLGDYFVVRVAGNIWEEAGLAATEFAVNEMGCTAVLVMGHTGCGAMQKAMQLLETGIDPEGDHFAHLIRRLVPAVEQTQLDEGDPWVNAVVRNVDLTIKDAMRKSTLLRRFEEEHKAAFLGGIYDIESGGIKLWKADCSLES